MDKQLRNQEKYDALKNSIVSELSKDDLLKQAARLMGAIGGRSGTGDAKRRSTEVCRQAVAKRWENYRRRKATGNSNETVS